MEIKICMESRPNDYIYRLEGDGLPTMYFNKEEDAELTRTVIKTLLAHGLSAKGIVNQMRYVFRLLKIENEYA